LSFNEIEEADYESRLLGHAKLDTTALYTRVATKTIREIVSPFDRITAKLREGAEPPA
jgi:integrase/recombinase XerD